MELLPRLTADLAKIGLCAIGGFGIHLNRKIIRPRINSERYNRISLPTEHFLSHALLAMCMDGSADLAIMMLGFPPSELFITNLAIAGSWSVGLIADMILVRSRQIDQFIADTAGCLAYAIPTLSLIH